MAYIKRDIENKILDALTDTPVVAIIGPRQSGKTTTAKHIVKNASYITLDDEDSLMLAKTDPQGLLRTLKKPVIIDEIQRCPEIMTTIKLLVDEDRQPGLFVLTGSADLLAVPRLSDSMAGRIEFITLLPFSQSELAGGTSSFLKRLESNDFTEIEGTTSQEELFDKITMGGYPEISQRIKRRRRAWFSAYSTALINRDITQVFELSKAAELTQMFTALAALTSSVLNINALSRSAGLSAATVTKYLSALESMFLVKKIPVWHANELKRQTKAPKVHFLDTGLLCATRQLTADDFVKNRNLLGNVFETFVVSEVFKQITNSENEYQIFHYRDRKKNEVDVILSGPKCSTAIKIKSSMSISSANLGTLYKLVETGGIERGIVVYTGSKVLKLSDRITAVPFDVLFS